MIKGFQILNYAFYLEVVNCAVLFSHLWTKTLQIVYTCHGAKNGILFSLINPLMYTSELIAWICLNLFDKASEYECLNWVL